eukprot:3522116-Rhodomonas_salina.1
MMMISDANRAHLLVWCQVRLANEKFAKNRYYISPVSAVSWRVLMHRYRLVAIPCAKCTTQQLLQLGPFAILSSHMALPEIGPTGCTRCSNRLSSRMSSTLKTPHRPPPVPTRQTLPLSSPRVHGLSRARPKSVNTCEDTRCYLRRALRIAAYSGDGTDASLRYQGCWYGAGGWIKRTAT